MEMAFQFTGQQCGDREMSRQVLTKVDNCDTMWTWNSSTQYHNLLNLLTCQLKPFSDGIKKESLSHVGHRLIEGITLTLSTLISFTSERSKVMSPPPKGTPEYDAWRTKMIASKTGQKQSDEVIQKRVAGIKASNAQRTPEEKAQIGAKVSAAKKGMKYKKSQKRQKGTPEYEAWVSKLSASQKGKPRWSEEDKARMSETRRGKPRPESAKGGFQKGHTPHNKGKPMSEEQKAKMSASLKGRVSPRKGTTSSPETRLRQSLAKKQRWETMSPEEKERIAEFLADQTRSQNRANTTIEVLLAQRLDTLGILYETQKRIGRYIVDFFLPEKGIALEALGCFWHGCLQCGFDTEKAQKARLKEEKRDAYLLKCGYIVHHIWEHDIQKGIMDTIEALL